MERGGYLSCIFEAEPIGLVDGLDVRVNEKGDSCVGSWSQWVTGDSSSCHRQPGWWEPMGRDRGARATRALLELGSVGCLRTHSEGVRQVAEYSSLRLRFGLETSSCEWGFKAKGCDEKA